MWPEPGAGAARSFPALRQQPQPQRWTAGSPRRGSPRHRHRWRSSRSRPLGSTACRQARTTHQCAGTCHGYCTVCDRCSPQAPQKSAERIQTQVRHGNRAEQRRAMWSSFEHDNINVVITMTGWWVPRLETARGHATQPALREGRRGLVPQQRKRSCLDTASLSGSTSKCRPHSPPCLRRKGRHHTWVQAMCKS